MLPPVSLSTTDDLVSEPSPSATRWSASASERKSWKRYARGLQESCAFRAVVGC
jgi:hypothetical protein